MDRRQVESVGGAVVGVIALALAAAMLPSAVERRGGGGGDGRAPPPEPQFPEVPPAGEGSELLALIATLVSVALLLVVVYYLVVRYRKRTVRALVLLAAFALLTLLVVVVLGELPLPEFTPPPVGQGEPGTGDDGTGQPTRVPPVLIVVVAVVLIAVAAAVALRLRNRADAEAGTEDEGEGPDAASVARAAGDAADRIDEGGAVGNEVYRAWREMRELLDLPSPRTRTPGEFADAAVEAGMAPDDVAELTRLFEDVRYGGDDPSAGTERRAREVLRRIEETYGDEPA